LEFIIRVHEAFGDYLRRQNKRLPWSIGRLTDDPPPDPGTSNIELAHLNDLLIAEIDVALCVCEYVPNLPNAGEITSDFWANHAKDECEEYFLGERSRDALAFSEELIPFVASVFGSLRPDCIF
jgi:hypothetical protein